MSIQKTDSPIYRQNVDFLRRMTDSKRFTPVSDVDDTIGSEGVTQVSVGPILRMTMSIPVLSTVIPYNPETSRATFTFLLNPGYKNHGRSFSSAPMYTSNGYVIQMWGPNQDILSSNGRTAVFMVEDEGLTATFRQSSYSFLNFMALVNTYRNNGYKILPAEDAYDLTKKIEFVQGVEITYDGDYFMGHFNNFTLDEDAANPFTFNYNFEFIVSNYSNGCNKIGGHFKGGPSESLAGATNTEETLKLKHVNDPPITVKKTSETKPPVTPSTTSIFDIKAQTAYEKADTSYEDSIAQFKVKNNIQPDRNKLEDDPTIIGSPASLKKDRMTPIIFR